jgi:hypothetical protein
VDFDKLREELIEENKDDSEFAVDVPEIGDDLEHHIRIQAKKIAARFTDATDTGERRRLEDRYKQLDTWLKQLSDIDRQPEEEREAAREKLRATMLDEFRRWEIGGSLRVSREQQIEMGRKHVVERARPGAASRAHKRIKDEIEYLLRNYTDANEAKIEALIDKWRRSGDPSYDPSIKVRLRSARRKKSRSDNPF